MMAGLTGLEPATSCVTGRRSNQLNYNPAREGPEEALEPRDITRAARALSIGCPGHGAERLARSRRGPGAPGAAQ
jgi:hypothetical protein